ncbi:ADORA2A [Branchiostoma lanceolatum]|uniref:ADORA2A protein n=1 Tax=Branchiostoma lanceolatum TaxID=7740 RepID=A0A8K0EFM8_BRALA|nr:ADORA2A [Branchiostoma lanceolatum]
MNHNNVTTPIARALQNVSEVVGVCEVVGNVTTNNNTLATVVFEPALCGLYGAAPSLAPVLILLLVCFLLLAVFGNGCLVGVILTTGHMKEPGNYFLVAMALTDTALALVYNPIAISGLAHGSYPAGPWCRLQAFFIIFLSVLSLHSLLGVWLCRYVHIAYPLNYKRVLTRRRMVHAMCLCVLIAAAPAALGVSPIHAFTVGASEEVLKDFEQPQTLITPCLAGPEGTILSVSVNLVAMVAIVCLVVLICCETRRNQTKHDQKMTWNAQAEDRESKMQAVYTLLIVVLVNWITWLPAFVVTILMKFGAVSLAAASPWIDVATIILQSATFSDSLVYAFRYHIYRRALKKMYREIQNIFTDA